MNKYISTAGLPEILPLWCSSPMNSIIDFISRWMKWDLRSKHLVGVLLKNFINPTSSVVIFRCRLEVICPKNVCVFFAELVKLIPKSQTALITIGPSDFSIFCAVILQGFCSDPLILKLLDPWEPTFCWDQSDVKSDANLQPAWEAKSLTWWKFTGLMMEVQWCLWAGSYKTREWKHVRGTRNGSSHWHAWAACAVWHFARVLVCVCANMWECHVSSQCELLLPYRLPPRHPPYLTHTWWIMFQPRSTVKEFEHMNKWPNTYGIIVSSTPLYHRYLYMFQG